VVTDGENVLHTYETLINPGKNIPAFITGLTGINNGAIENAPSFALVAPVIYDLLKDCIFVAHNVNFDYSFVRNELYENNLTLNPRKLCTLRLSRKIFSGYTHYSLGNICSFLKIDIENRHRAMGDAYATFQLLQKLIINDKAKEIEKALKRNSFEQTLPPNLPREEFEKLPTTAGVYYFHDEHRKIIYVGKAINIKKRVSSHFTGNVKSPQRQAFLREIHSVTYELTGNELIALLHEASEIRSYWPKYNRAQKKPERSFGIFEYTGNDGFIRLAIEGLNKNNNHALARFDTFAAAHECLMNSVIEYNLCLAKTSVKTTAETNQLCDEKCSCKKGHRDYNKRVNKAKAHLTTGNKSYAVTARGRTPEEISFILVKEGQYRGYGFIDAASFSLNTLDDHVKPAKHNHTALIVIESFTTRFNEEYKLVVLG
jgi:DNA polymerase-3 subunit epsilon